MISRPLLIDLLIAAVIAAVVVVLAGGVALSAALAVVALALCGITVVVDRRRAQRLTRRRWRHGR